MEKQDEELIMEYYQGCEEALEMLFHRYKKPVLNFALRILNNRADAEDVTGEVFVVVFEKKYVQKPKAKFSTWLFTVAHNACITRIRKRKKTISLWFTKNDSGEYEPWDVVDPKTSPREELVKRETALEVKKAIAKLPDTQKEALILREYHHFSYEQITEVLSCSLENVKILIYRARERLRTELPSSIMEDHDG